MNNKHISCDELFLKYKYSVGAYIKCISTSYIPSYTMSPGSSRPIIESIYCEINNNYMFNNTTYYCYEKGVSEPKDYALKYNLTLTKTNKIHGNYDNDGGEYDIKQEYVIDR